ncbi:MAG: DUF4296 domain-containing protein [Bacteroidales bacterium]|nr:DUF4296 domain-containing protein [Bacteroidales bacterium]
MKYHTKYLLVPNLKLIIGFLLVAIVSLSISCKRNDTIKTPKPEIMLAENQMVQIITDISLAEASLNYKRNKGVTLTGFKEPVFSLIFEKHGITRQIIEENLNWYNQNPELMEKIYDSVMVQLNSIRDEVSKPEPKLPEPESE